MHRDGALSSQRGHSSTSESRVIPLPRAVSRPVQGREGGQHFTRSSNLAAPRLSEVGPDHTVTTEYRAPVGGASGGSGKRKRDLSALYHENLHGLGAKGGF